MTSTAAPFDRPVSCNIEGEKVNLINPSTSELEAPKPSEMLRPISLAPSKTSSTPSAEHKAVPWEDLRYKGGIVHTELFNTKQKLRWQLNRHKGFLNMALCICVLIVLASVIIISFVFITTLFPAMNMPSVAESCRAAPCSISLCETVPLVIPPDNFQPRFQPTHEAWGQLITKATNGSVLPIVIASQYWSMQSDDIPGGPWPSAQRGEDIFARLKALASSENELTIVDSGNMNESEIDLQMLNKLGANTYTLRITQLLGAGILHTKSWLVGNDAFYVGSANMDWRSLSDVKEMGVLVDLCPCLASDISRIFTVYLGLATGKLSLDSIPKLPALQALSNMTNRMLVTDENNQKLAVYISSSPPQMSGRYRTNDVDAVVDLITTARQSVCIEVMDYSPAIVFQHPRLFWPNIDDAIRRVAYQSGSHLSVRMLIGFWAHTAKDQVNYLKSLLTFYPSKIQVRYFEVPGWNSSDPTIPPYSRVNHAKFLVTESSAWIGTSNWSGDYFTSTAGIGVVVRSAEDNSTSPKLVSDLQAAFDRDWNSAYAVPLTL